MSQTGSTAILSTATCLNISNIKPHLSLESDNLNEISTPDTFEAKTENKSVARVDNESNSAKSTKFFNGLQVGTGLSTHSTSSKTNSDYYNGYYYSDYSSDTSSNSNSESIEPVPELKI